MPKGNIIKPTTGDVIVLQIYNAKQILCNAQLFEIGRGSFGEVLHVWHKIIGDHAVKCFTVTGGERQQSALEKKILKEYNKLQECQHKNVVIVFGITKWSGSMGILMEFCEGGNLKVLLLDDSIVLGPGLILRMNLDIASGVAFIHNCGLDKRVIHGDLKPENILLTAWLVCKITDFGSAQLASYTGYTTIDGRRERQAFTLFYAAPEKLRHGARPKKEQDTYSCGMIQHMTLTHEDPYLSDHEFERKLELGLHPNCEAIQELKEESNESNREIVECIEGAMVRCWDHDPSNRPDMISIRDEFQDLMAKQDHAVIAQQVADAVGGMNIQHPPQNPTVPLDQFSTELRKFVGGGATYLSDSTSPKLPVGGGRLLSCDVTQPKLAVGDDDSAHLSDITSPKLAVGGSGARLLSSDVTNPKVPVDGARLLSIDVTNPKLPVDVRPCIDSPLDGNKLDCSVTGSDSAHLSDVTIPKLEVGGDILHACDVTNPKLVVDVMARPTTAEAPQSPPSDRNLQTPFFATNLSNQDVVHLQPCLNHDASEQDHGANIRPQTYSPLGGNVEKTEQPQSPPDLDGGERKQGNDAKQRERRSINPTATSSSARSRPDSSTPSKRDSSGFLVIGGVGSERDCVKWNVATKQHQHLPKLNSTRTFSTSAKVGNTVYVMGGKNRTKFCEMMNLEETEHWAKFADLLDGRSSAASAVVQDDIFLTGGRGRYSKVFSCLIYDVQEDRWRKGFNMLQPRYAHGMCSINNVSFCIGGMDGRKPLQSCEFYDLRCKTSSQISSLNEARSSLACLDVGGMIYAIGGDGGLGPLQTVEGYEPRVNKWKYVSPLLTPRCRHSACDIDGRIYVVGGSGSLSEELTSVEVYDPTSDAWTHAFDLDKPVYGATVVAV